MSKELTPIVNGAFLALSEPRIAPGGDEDSAKYGVTVVLDADDKFWIKLQKKIDAAAIAKWGKIPPKCVMPIKDGDDTEYPEFAGCNTVSVASKRRPEIVDANVQPMMSLNGIGSGDLFRISYNVYCWEYGGIKKGVSLGLSNVMWISEGEERWDGGSKAASDFADFAEEDGDAEDLLG